MMQVISEGTMCCSHFIGRNSVNVLERNISILMLGLDNTGKTCTAKSLVGESLDTVAPTVGFAKETTKYKGFRINIFDLGGSKSFRGIWPKYYHEVHGFIFVVDSTSSNERMVETSNVFKDILSHQKVRGKPILMLCNKADVNEARDEMNIVDTLKVERLVNEAKCPTRVEISVATKNQGLRDGYKWLVKSIIANLPELGPRVELDVEEERLKEDIRRAEVRKRIEERKRRQNDEIEEEEEDIQDIPGFVPIEKYNSASKTNPKPPIQPTIIQNAESEDDIDDTDNSTSPNPTIRVCSSEMQAQKSPSPAPHPTPSQHSISRTNTPLEPSPVPQIGNVGPSPQLNPIIPQSQPGPVGPLSQTASGQNIEDKLFSPRSPQVVKSNGVITILPSTSPVLEDIGSNISALENVSIHDHSPRTPLPPIGSTIPSPFLQMPINNLAETTENSEPQDITVNNVVSGGIFQNDIIGRDSSNSEEEANINGSIAKEGGSESSSVFESKRNSLTGSVTSLGGHIRRDSSASSNGLRRLELEPLSRQKTKSVLKKVINNNYKVNTAYSKPIQKTSSGESNPSSNNGSRSGSAYRNRRASLVFKPIVNW